MLWSNSWKVRWKVKLAIHLSFFFFACSIHSNECVSPSFSNIFASIKIYIYLNDLYQLRRLFSRFNFVREREDLSEKEEKKGGEWWGRLDLNPHYFKNRHIHWMSFLLRQRKIKIKLTFSMLPLIWFIVNNFESIHYRISLRGGCL